MNFYLTQVMSGNGAFNVYLFRMKLVESPDCSNCDRRGRDDDAWHTMFECPAFRLYQEDAMTNLQDMGEQTPTPDSLVLIMLKSTDRWDQVAAFVALTMHSKMEIAQKWQRRPIAAAIQHPMLDLVISPLPVFAISNPATEKEDDPGWSTSATNTTPKPRMLNKGRV